MNVTTYDPQLVMFTVGESVCQGWNSFSVVRGGPAFTTIKGIRGKHTRTKNYDQSFSIRVSLPFASEWNDYFSEIVRQDLLTGSGRCEVLLKDVGGTSLFKSREAFLVGYPDITFDSSQPDKVWIFQCLSVDVFVVGGITDPAASLADALTSGIRDLF